MSNTDDFLLSAGFEAPSHQTWIELATATLKGRSPDSLATKTLDDITIAALYTDNGIANPVGLPGQAPFTRGSRAAGQTASWDVRQLHTDPDLGRANAAVLDDLERGAMSLLLDLDRLGVDSVDDLDRLLDGVQLDLAGVYLRPSQRGIAGAEWLLDLWEERGLPNSAAIGGLGVDPIAMAARSGLAADLDLVVPAFRLAEAYPSVPALSVDLTPYADAGAADAQEIAYSLATGVEYLRTLTSAGVSVDDALGALAFTYSVSADQFAGIAKLRAARTVWARIGEASGASARSSGQSQHVITATSMMTVADPWVNLLRVTVACFAAATGGAEAITTLPFDSAAGVSDELGRRTARNIQMLLLEESNLSRVIDPAGGSWFVEQLSAELADAAWTKFQAIEEAGGMVAAQASGLIAEQIAAMADERSERAATRSDPIIGVSEFPNIDETPIGRPVAPAGPVGGLPAQRLAQPFEALRSVAAKASPRPTVFLAKLGSSADYTARASYAKDFFEVAGVAGVGVDGFDSPLAAAAAFANSGARVAVICSSNERYAERAEATARALKGSSAERVYLAGRPGEKREMYEAAGVDEFVHVGVDVLSALQRLHELLGLEAAAQ